MVAAQDDPFLAPLLGGEHVGEEIPPAALAVRAGRGHHLPGPRRQERVRVDLAVRMRQGDADLGASVLEAEDLLHVRQSGQRQRAVRPRVDDGTHAPRRQSGERGIVVRGEAHDLAAPSTAALLPQPRLRTQVRPGRQGGEGREPVLEHDYVVGGRRNLRRPRWRGRAERALVVRREVRPALPVIGLADPLVEQRVVAYRGTRQERGEVARVAGLAYRVVRLVEVDDLAAVGEPGLSLLHARPSVVRFAQGRPARRSRLASASC